MLQEKSEFITVPLLGIFFGNLFNNFNENIKKKKSIFHASTRKRILCS